MPVVPVVPTGRPRFKLGFMPLAQSPIDEGLTDTPSCSSYCRAALVRLGLSVSSRMATAFSRSAFVNRLGDTPRPRTSLFRAVDDRRARQDGEIAHALDPAPPVISIEATIGPTVYTRWGQRASFQDGDGADFG